RTPHSVTITNTGNQPTGALTVALSGTNASSFALSTTSVATIAVSGTGNFTVVPNTGLAVGTYTATVTVSGSNSISATFNVSFTVNKANGIAVGTPTMASVTHNSITINAVPSPANGQAVEYAINTTATAPTSVETWHAASLQFDELTPSTTYYVFARSMENTNYNTGTASVSAPITTQAAPVEPTYGITLNQSGTHTFTAATFGYSARTPHSVTITNTGNQPTGALTVALSGTNAGSFALSTTSVATIAVSGTGNFTVVPNTGLTAGTYTATVTVSGSNSISATFNVSFTVEPDPTSISETENPLTLNIYPNPIVDGKLTIEIPVNIESEIIQIFDFSGKLMLTRVVNRPKTEIDLSHLPEGTYIVRIGTASTKIVKHN
ncbi:MAG: T9SS type A sorting domain-containing protein, partial [Bacteroidales bacterium]|nr:T9SS type A sorting domain-containing protein [Bacteroidales bacterium]